MLLSNKTFKRTIAALLCSSLVLSSQAVPFVDAAKKVTKVSKISVSNNSVKNKKVTLKKGKTLTLKVKVTPKKAKNKKVSYKTSNKKVATVTSKGKITAKGVGTCKITITAKDGSRKKCVITVNVIKDKSAPKPSAKPSAKPSPVVSKTPSTSSTPAPTTPTNSKEVKINEKTLVIRSASAVNNNDFTICLVGELEDGTKLCDLVPSQVKTALAGTKITLVGEKKQCTASYSDYSNDKDQIIFKIDDPSILQTKNSDFGEADGTYKVTSENLRFSGDVDTSYYEVLVGNSLDGFVYDKVTKLPIKNATVTAHIGDSYKTIKTDDTGYYRIALISGTADLKAKVEGSVDYFAEIVDDIKISNNNKTAENIYVDAYNREELFISGNVKSESTKENLSNAVVGLYEEKTDGTYSLVKELKTSDNGAFLFMNSAASSSDEYKNYASRNKISSTNTSYHKFKYGKGLDKNKKYKVIIEKDFAKNLNDAYEKKEIDVTIGDTRRTNVNATLRAIEQIKKFTLDAKWDCALPKVNKNAVTMSAVLYDYDEASATYKSIRSSDIIMSVNTDTKSIKTCDLVNTELFSAKYPTIPTGKYYLRLDDKNTSVSAYSFITLDVVEGQNISVSAAIKPAKSTALVTTCDIKNNETRKNYVSGSTAKIVTDTKGTLKTVNTGTSKLPAVKNVDVTPLYSLYYKDGENLVHIKEINSSLNYEKKSSTFSISSTTHFARTQEGLNYVIIPQKSYIYGDDKISFSQSDSVSDSENYKCSGAADINCIKIASLDQFKADTKNTVTASTNMVVEKVTLYEAETDKIVGIADYEDEATSVKSKTVNELIKTGVSIPATAVGLKGIKPTNLQNGSGKYKVGLKLKGYEEVTTTISVTDFQDVTVVEDDNINYIQETTIAGNINLINRDNSEDAQDTKESTIDALLVLYDKTGTIVGATTYGNKKTASGQLEKGYSFVNGENAYLEEEGEYTLVVRGTHHNDAYSFDTLVTKINVVKNKKNSGTIDVQHGNNASVTITATDEKYNILEDATVTLYDENYIDLSSAKIYDGFNIRSTLSSVNTAYPTLLGVYDIPQSNLDKKTWFSDSNLSKGNYTAVITSARTIPYTFKDGLTIASGQNCVSTSHVISLIYSEDTVKVALEYAHNLPKGVKSPFEVIRVLDEKNKLVSQVEQFATKANTDETLKKLEYNTANVYVPNRAGTYTIEIYSSGSFVCSEKITLQSVGSSIKLELKKSTIN